MAYKISDFSDKTARRILAQMQAEDAGKLRPIRQPEPVVQKPKPPQLIRQNTRGPNKLEAAFAAVLRAENPGVQIREQAVTILICNGVRYTPDMFAVVDGKMKAWETKGFLRDDAGQKLKFAAKEWPEIEFTLVWRKDGVWHRQRILA